MAETANQEVNICLNIQSTFLQNTNNSFELYCFQVKVSVLSRVNYITKVFWFSGPISSSY